jgi:hypothetical protein
MFNYYFTIENKVAPILRHEILASSHYPFLIKKLPLPVFESLKKILQESLEFSKGIIHQQSKQTHASCLQGTTYNSTILIIAIQAASYSICMNVASHAVVIRIQIMIKKGSDSK